MKYLYQVQPSKKENESGIYRSPLCKNTGSLLSKFSDNEATSIVELLATTIDKYRTRRALGYRKVIKIHREEHHQSSQPDESKSDSKTKKKTFSYPELSKYYWLSFNEMGKMMRLLSSGFGELGLTSQTKVAFYAPASYQWLLMAFGLFHQNATVATIYDTLGEEGLLHGIEQCESTALFLSSDQFPTLKNIYKRAKNLTTIFYTGELSEKADLQSEFPGLKFYSWDQLLELGKQNPHDTIQPKSDDLAVIMYTSGTTGPPKGVLLTHSQLIASAAGSQMNLRRSLQEDEVYISFLPLAHILALTTNIIFLEWGIPIGYATPRTLMDNGVRHCRGDLCELKPTIIAGVPQIFDTIRKNINNQIREAGQIAGFLFKLCFLLKHFMMSLGLPTWLLDTLIFKAIANSTGGRIRLGLCGGAPLSPEVSDFITTVLFPVAQGYGMTETSGVASVMIPNSGMGHGSAGSIIPSVEIKLRDVPEAGYFHSDMVGELLIRGNNVFKGYHKNPQASSESLTEDNWLKTGDIVRIEKAGDISVVDRIKNLVKLANGEYIALEQLESDYSNSDYVQSICLIADSHQRQPIAIIQPNRTAITSLASSLRLPSPASGDRVDPQLTKKVYRSLLDLARRRRFPSSSQLAAIHISTIDFTPENQLLTAARKLNRRAIQSHFQEEIKRMTHSSD